MITKRLFLAVDLPQEIKEQIDELIKSNSELDVKWKNPEMSHLTLVFLGNINVLKIADMISKAEDICLKNKDFYLKLIGLGIIKKKNRQLLHLSVLHPKKLEKLHQDLTGGLAEFIDKRKNRFNAHVTIGKFGKKEDIGNIIENNIDRKFGEFKVETITLFESDFSESEPKYIPMHSFYLK